LVAEERPCSDADGSLVGFDKPVGAMQPSDVYVVDRSVTPAQTLSLPGLNDATKDETGCVLDAAGEYVGLTSDPSGTPAFRVYQVASQEFLPLPADRELDSRSLFSAAYTPPQPGGGGTPAPPPTGDRTKPVLSRVRMTNRRFRVRPRATAFRFGLSESAGREDRAAALRALCGADPASRPPGGAEQDRWGGRLRGRKLCPAPYVAVVIATDPAGNLSLPVLTSFRVLRPEGDRRP
jgi:hypothetical protein